MTVFEGKVAAITGAASGIGRALAHNLARRGAALALADRDADGLARTAASIAAPPARITQHVVDVASDDAVRRYAQEAIAAHGAVDLVVNNAGVALYGTILELSLEEMHWLIDVNFWGVVHGVKAFLPHLLTRPDATIVNVSSVFGLWGPPGNGPYAASKFAVRGFSESLRGELADSHVHVLTVHPGGVKTGIARSSRIAAAADARVAKILAQQFEERMLTITPEAAAAAIVRGIERNDDRVLIGKEAVQIDLFTRLLGPRAGRIFNKRLSRLRERSAVALRRAQADNA